jgi:hypothetical protein
VAEPDPVAVERRTKRERAGGGGGGGGARYEATGARSEEGKPAFLVSVAGRQSTEMKQEMLEIQNPSFVCSMFLSRIEDEERRLG